jgi:DNA-binding LacI/PurR family transcriptional regulator
MDQIGTNCRRESSQERRSKTISEGESTRPNIHRHDLGKRNHVDIENAQGGRLVGQLFARCGYRRIALINGPECNIDAIERERGFFDALKEAGISETAKRYGDFTIMSGMSALADLLVFRPDAVFCTNDFMAAGAMRCLTESGIRIPDDVSIVGYDNNDISIGVVPTLTTIDNRLREAGERIAEALLNLIKGIKETFSNQSSRYWSSDSLTVRFELRRNLRALRHRSCRRSDGLVIFWVRE